MDDNANVDSRPIILRGDRGRGTSDRQDNSAIWTAIDRVRDDAVAVALRTSNHEVLCAERYKEINGKLKIVMGGIALVMVSQMLGLDHAVRALLHMSGVSP